MVGIARPVLRIGHFASRGADRSLLQIRDSRTYVSQAAMRSGYAAVHAVPSSNVAVDYVSLK